MEVNIKTSHLGQTFSFQELRNQCRTIWGGVSWPEKREVEGFIVVAAMSYETYPYNHRIYLLDEYESFDMRELISQCMVMNFKYSSERWIGDDKNDAATKFIYESNRNNSNKRFSLTPTSMLEMEKLYAYIIPQIKELLNPERRQLFLKDSKIDNYLRSIKESEIPELERGEYPAIEALAFVVLEMRKYIELQERTPIQRPKEKPRHIGLLGFNKKKRSVRGM